MARRSSIFEDLMSLAAGLPWRYGVGLAVASFVPLHLLAVHLSTSVAAQSLADLGAGASRQLLATITSIGQVLLPLAFLVGAVVSFVRRKKGFALFNDAQQGGTPVLTRMSWQEFEHLIAEAFRQRGYAVLENLQGGADGGVDLVLKRDSRVSLVQCKHWRRASVGVSVVRELNGVIAARGARGGFVITSGTFTPEARSFASDCKLELIDGQALQALLARVARTQNVDSRPIVPEARQCPQCGSAMLLRTARRGASTGKQFWGCGRFPHCRGTVAV
jgi:restriction system protein